MSLTLFALLVATGSCAAGLLGALTGIGGGIVIIPMLTMLFHIDLRYAIGASLVSIIATSSGAATAYVREGWTNVRIGILLEVGTTIGALLGAALAPFVPTRALSILLALVLLFTAWRSSRAPDEPAERVPSHPWARRLRLDGSYPTRDGRRAYGVQAVPQGFSLMFLAGVLSALLGIGSGVLKVLAMDRFMKLPFKVSTTTSNFMIGVTAAASAGVYLHRGYIVPEIAGPVMLGVLAGAVLGARLLTVARTPALRLLFNAVVVVLALQMLYEGVRGGGGS